MWISNVAFVVLSPESIEVNQSELCQSKPISDFRERWEGHHTKIHIDNWPNNKNPK